MAGKSSSLKQPRRDQEVVHDPRAPPARGPVPVVALHLAPPDDPVAPPRPTTVLAPAAAPLPVETPPPNQRSRSNAPPRPVSLPLLPPLHPLREPLSPVPAPVPAPALVRLLPTANANSCVQLIGNNEQRKQLVSSVDSAWTSWPLELPSSCDLH